VWEVVVIIFRVGGEPVAQGSKRAFTIRGTNRATVVETASKRLKPWRSEVRAAAVDAMAGRPLLTGPIRMVVAFYLPRPQTHYRGSDRAKGLKPTAPVWCDKKPDADKLLRAVGDALKGAVYHDDGQLADIRPLKMYADPQPPGAAIHVEMLTGTVGGGR
jgi:crossover junction endodeoxyribonuclease RusA